MLNPEHQVNWLNGDFALSVWIRPDPGCNGYLVLKASRSETEVYYSLRMTADSRGVPVSVVLSLLSYHTLVSKENQSIRCYSIYFAKFCGEKIHKPIMQVNIILFIHLCCKS